MPFISQLKLLISLAQVDGAVAEREKNYIRTIGLANGMNETAVESLFDQRHELIVPEDLSVDQKFDYIFSLVQLMKIDEKMYKDEILFCAKIATRLGYSQDVMFDLMLNVKSATMGEDELKFLQKLTQRHLS